MFSEIEKVTVIMLSSTSNTLEDTSISIFPNPSSGAVKIDIGEKWQGPIRLEAINAKGKVAFFIELNQDQEVINLELGHLPKGVYILSLSEANTGKTASQFMYLIE